MGAKASGFLKASPPPRNLRFFTGSGRRVSGRAAASAHAALYGIVVKLRVSRSKQQGGAVAQGMAVWCDMASIGPWLRGDWGGSGDRLEVRACALLVLWRPRRDPSSGAGQRAENRGLVVGGSGDPGGGIIPGAHRGGALVVY